MISFVLGLITGVALMSLNFISGRWKDNGNT